MTGQPSEWPHADAALAADELADRAGVQHEHGQLARLEPYVHGADPVGVLGPVLARLRATARASGHDEGDIWCGPGWSRLIAQTDRRLAELDPDYQLWQVKEKYGQLRYYADGVRLAPADAERFRSICHAAEVASEMLCEVCGRAGAELRGRLPRRVRTLCPTHNGWGASS